MGLKEIVVNDMKLYMRAKDSLALNTIRMLLSEIKYAEISKKEQLEEDEIVKIVMSGIKKRKDAAEQFERGGRTGLAEKELKEIQFLDKYLPEQLSENEIESIIINIVQETEDRNFGQIMKQVMPKVKGKAEGTVVNRLVRRVLDGNK